MNKNTANAIQRRIQAGEKHFLVGDRAYTVTDLGAVLFEYTSAPHYSGSCAGIVLDGVFVPDRYFTPVEIAERRAADGGHAAD